MDKITVTVVWLVCIWEKCYLCALAHIVCLKCAEDVTDFLNILLTHKNENDKEAIGLGP